MSIGRYLMRAEEKRKRDKKKQKRQKDKTRRNAEEAVAKKRKSGKGAKRAKETMEREPLGTVNGAERPKDKARRVSDMKGATPEEKREVARQNLRAAIDEGLAESTRDQYDGYVERFVKFATEIGVKPEAALPSDPEVVSLFLADGIGITGPGNAMKKISSLKSWHKDKGIEFIEPANTDRIYKGIAKRWPKNEKPEELRPPITSEMMEGLIKEWKDGTEEEIAALALAIAGWCGLCRLGELIPLSKKGVDRSKHPQRGHWKVVRRNDEGAATSSTLYLPWTKTTRAKGATIELVEQRDDFNPSKAIERHLQRSKFTDQATLLCEYKDERGRREMLDKDRFMEMCNAVWEPLGLGKFTGHCFRIGGTTAYLMSGVEIEIVKKMGRWTSESFKLYWRNLGGIISYYAANVVWKDKPTR